MSTSGEKSFSRVHDGVLNNLWDRGMNTRASSMVKEAVEKTGLSLKEVKIWVTNKNKREKRAANRLKGLKPKRKQRPAQRQKRGYDIFMSERLSEEDLCVLPSDKQGYKLKVGQEGWRNLSQEEKEKYEAKAREMKDDANIDVKDQTEHLKAIILKKSQQLWKLGCKATFLCPDNEGQIDVLADPSVDLFWKSKPSAMACLQDLSHELNLAGVNTGEDSNSLRKKVQSIFNEAYSRATGKPVRMDYSQLENGQLRVIGLPLGVDAKRPSSYTVLEKRAIIESASSVVIEIVQTHVEGDSSLFQEQPEMSRPTDPGTSFGEDNTDSTPGDTDDDANALRRKVQGIFNEAYSRAVGKPGRMDYSGMEKGKVQILGLPTGIKAKRPGSYSIQQKKAIVMSSSSVVIQVVKPSAEGDSPLNQEHSGARKGVLEPSECDFNVQTYEFTPEGEVRIVNGDSEPENEEISVPATLTIEKVAQLAKVARPVQMEQENAPPRRKRRRGKKSN